MVDATGSSTVVQIIAAALRVLAAVQCLPIDERAMTSLPATTAAA